MNRITQIATVVFITFSLSGCYYDRYPELPLPSNISYSNDVQPIWTSTCISCHNGNLEPDLRVGSSYDALMALPAGSIIPGNAEGSEFFEMLNGAGTNPMPPGSSLPQAQINIVGQWINEGALNN